jgi:hypothetical protein
MKSDDSFAIYRYHQEVAKVVDFKTRKSIEDKTFFDTTFDHLKY